MKTLYSLTNAVHFSSGDFRSARPLRAPPPPRPPRPAGGAGAASGRTWGDGNSAAASSSAVSSAGAGSRKAPAGSAGGGPPPAPPEDGPTTGVHSYDAISHFQLLPATSNRTDAESSRNSMESNGSRSAR